MTSFVVVVGFYMLMLYKDQLYQSVDEVDTDDAGDGKTFKLGLLKNWCSKASLSLDYFFFLTRTTTLLYAVTARVEPA